MDQRRGLSARAQRPFPAVSGGRRAGAQLRRQVGAELGRRAHKDGGDRRGLLERARRAQGAEDPRREGRGDGRAAGAREGRGQDVLDVRLPGRRVLQRLLCPASRRRMGGCGAQTRESGLRGPPTVAAGGRWGAELGPRPGAGAREGSGAGPFASPGASWAPAARVCLHDPPHSPRGTQPAASLGSS